MNCPKCRDVDLRKKEYDFPYSCEKYGGIWFDNDEWQRIIKKNLTENLNGIWCKSWQTQQRKNKNRNSYLETNRKRLGDNAFDEIMKLSELLKDHPEKGRAIALLQQEISDFLRNRQR